MKGSELVRDPYNDARIRIVVLKSCHTCEIPPQPGSPDLNPCAHLRLIFVAHARLGSLAAIDFPDQIDAAIH